jgi:hypothetical protein
MMMDEKYRSRMRLDEKYGSKGWVQRIMMDDKYR